MLLSFKDAENNYDYNTKNISTISIEKKAVKAEMSLWYASGEDQESVEILEAEVSKVEELLRSDNDWIVMSTPKAVCGINTSWVVKIRKSKNSIEVKFLNDKGNFKLGKKTEELYNKLKERLDKNKPQYVSSFSEE